MAKKTARAANEVIIDENLWQELSGGFNLMAVTVTALRQIVCDRLKIGDSEWQEALIKARAGLDSDGGPRARPKRVGAKKAVKKSPPKK